MPPQASLAAPIAQSEKPRFLTTPWALVVAYVLTGKLALLLALPPGYASAIFPPAGIALAGALIGGRRALPWIFLASLLLNLWAGYSPAHAVTMPGVTAALLIAAASMSQAACGGWWLRRAIGHPCAFDQASDVARFLLLAPAICIVSASLSVGGLTLLSVFNSSDLTTNWATWWLGDTLGVIVALPLALIVAGQPRAIWRNRKYTVAVPILLALTLFVFVFIKANRWEQEESLMEFRAQAQRMADRTQDRFNDQEFLIDAMDGFLSHDPKQPIDREEFQRFAAKSLSRFPDIQAIEWAPRISNAQRNQFETAQRSIFPDFEIREKNASGNWTRAAEHPEYYPVTYLEPFSPNSQALGYDLATSPERRQALQTSRTSGVAVATPPIRLVQETGEQQGMLLIRAVEHGNYSGAILTVLRLNDFIEQSPAYQRLFTQIRLTDVGSQAVLFDTIGHRERGAGYEQMLTFGTRILRLEFIPTEAYLHQHRGWQSWTVLSVGLFGTGLLGALLLLGTGYTARVEAKVTEQTEDLRESSEKLRSLFELSPLGIALTDMQGRYLEFNEAFRTICGYSDEELRHLNYWALTPKKYQEAEARQLESLKRCGRYGPYEKEYLRKDGSLVPINLNGLLLTGKSDEKLVWSIVEDISQRKQVEESLRRSEERWKFALEGAGDGLWDWNLQTGEMFLTRQEMAVLGYEGEEACHTNIEDWERRQHPLDREVRQTAIERYLAGDAPIYISEFRTRCRDGRWRWIRARGILVSRSDDGKPLRMIGTHTDIDSSKRLASRESMRNGVMEMLAQGGRLPAVLAKVMSSLDDGNDDFAYGAFVLNKDHLRLLAGHGLPSGMTASTIDLANSPESPRDSTHFAGEWQEARAESGAYWQGIAKLSASTGLQVCWSEPILSTDRELEGTLISFRKALTQGLPDLEAQHHGANLMSIAIQRKRIEERLLLASCVYEASSEAIMVLDDDNHILAVNPAFTRITGYELADVAGCNPRLFQSGRQDAAFYQSMWRTILETGSWQGELWNRRKNGDTYPVWMTVNTIIDEVENHLRRTAVFSDITDKKLAEEHIHHMARHDALTGLPNRILFDDRLCQALAVAKRDHTRVALLYLDLDHFKPINDTFGHMMGDQLLQAAAIRMVECVRESDTVARIGGDEFVILLPNIKVEEDAQVVAEKIRQAMSEPFVVAGHQLEVSSSIGIALYPDHGEDLLQLSKSADSAMYGAKRHGRNNVQLFHQDEGLRSA